MTVTRADIIREARGFLGTPFVHQARKPGVGLDCMGVLMEAGRQAGLPVQDFTRYSRQPNPNVLLYHFRRNFDEIPVEAAGPGDVLLFWWRQTRRLGRLPQHGGLIVDRVGAPQGLGLLHSHEDSGKVLEVDLEATWRPRILSAWSYKGIS